MRLEVIGLNHITAPLYIRERMAISREQTSEALLFLFNFLEQGIILSTCNRTEVYFLGDGSSRSAEDVNRFLCAHSGIALSELKPHLYLHRQEEAVRYLFKVASGLDSMVVGEFEVLGQVGYALEEAEKTGRISLPLLQLFRHAVRVGRRVREETAISRNPVSVSSASVELCRRLFNNLERCKVLVISAGEAGGLTAQALAKNGVSNITIINRSYVKAQELAASLGGKALPFYHLSEALKACDIAVSCSGSPHYILEGAVVADAMQARPQRPLIIMDIAVPRDVDPEVSNVPNVSLYDIDDLVEICESNRQQREQETEKVLKIIEEEVAKFMDWWRGLEVRPTIAALVEKAEAIRQAQLELTMKKLKGISEEDKVRVEAMTKAIVKKVLRHPILALKNNHSSKDLLQAAQQLFELDGKG